MNNLELIEIYPITYYNNLGFQKGDKIRVDSQDNAWIITRHDGVRVIKNNATLWPDGEGFTKNNSMLLSDFVYDIAFDSNENVFAKASNAAVSLGKHAPPNPLLLSKPGTVV